MGTRGSPGGSVVKNLLALGGEDPLVKALEEREVGCHMKIQK